MTHRILQPAVAGIVSLVLACTLVLHASAAPKANPFAAGECTSGVWQVWVGWSSDEAVRTRQLDRLSKRERVARR